MKKPDMKSYIRQLVYSRGMTLSRLTSMLGYSSQNSLTRLMNDCANSASLQQFAKRVHTCKELNLTRAESSLLDDLIELHDIGDDFNTMVSMRRLLRGEAVVYQEKLSVYGLEGCRESFMAHFGALKIRRMLLLNSETTEIFGDLANLMQEKGFPVEHLMYTRGEPYHMVSCLRAIMPLLFLSGYRGYTYSFTYDPAAHTRGAMTSDLLICEYEAADGSIRSEMTLFTSPCRGEMMPLSISMEQAMRMIPDRSLLQPVRKEIEDSDLLKYAEFCADLERGRVVCRIKQEPGIEQIPYHIMERSIIDKVPKDMLPELYLIGQVFIKRQQDMQDKDVQQYHIFKLGAMRRFIETGRLSDHLWCCRPFTPSERLEILCFIRYTLMEKDNFHLRFLKNDDAVRIDEIVLYEDYGLSIIRPDTDYEPGKSHMEVLITQPEFLRFYKRFFLESTMRYRVGSREDAFRDMEILIEECKALVETKASVNEC